MEQLQKRKYHKEANTECVAIYQKEDGHRSPHHAAANRAWELRCLQEKDWQGQRQQLPRLRRPERRCRARPLRVPEVDGQKDRAGERSGREDRRGQSDRHGDRQGRELK